MPKAATARRTSRPSPLGTSSGNASMRALTSKTQNNESGRSSEPVEIEDDSSVTADAHKNKGATHTESYLLLVSLIAFGWAGCHAWSFDVHKLLEEGERPDWMTGQGKTLASIQNDADMMAGFMPDLEIKEAKTITLSDVYSGNKFGDRVAISYEYDHGDSWDHRITFLGRADPMLRKSMMIPECLEAVCLAGEGHPCAEDCGSVPGWEDLKAVFKERG